MIKTLIPILWMLISSSGTQLEKEKRLEIVSLEGGLFNLTIKTDVINERANVELTSSESISLKGFKDLVETPKLFGDRFLAVRFKIKGGSGLTQEQLSIFCVSNNKLYSTLEVLSRVSSKLNEVYNVEADSPGLYDEKSDYEFVITNIIAEGSDYMVFGTERYKKESKYDPSENCDIEGDLKFHFDPQLKVFYNEESVLNGSFTINCIGDNKAKNRYFLNEIFPTITLRNFEYYFIENDWFLRDGSNHLTQL